MTSIPITIYAITMDNNEGVLIYTDDSEGRDFAARLFDKMWQGENGRSVAYQGVVIRGHDSILDGDYRHIFDFRGMTSENEVDEAIRKAFGKPTKRAQEQTLLPVGTRIQTLGGSAQGDWDEDGDGNERHTQPDEWGTIWEIEQPQDCEPYYHVTFEPSGVWVCLDYSEVTNPEFYRIS